MTMTATALSPESLAPAVATYGVVLHRRAQVDATLASIAKRAARRGLPVPAWTWGAVTTETETHTFRHPEYTDTFVERRVRVTRIALTLSAEPVRYAGWRFVAAIDHLGEEGGNLVRTLPGEECPVRFRAAASNCDHCRARRVRKATYVLRHEDGRVAQVGSTCVDDFLGGHDALDVAMMASIVADLRRAAEIGEGYEGGCGPSGELGLEELLDVVAYKVRTEGWVSRTTAREEGREGTATADRALSCFFTDKGRDEYRAGRTNEDGALAAASLAWAAALSDEEVDAASGDYLHNLRAIALAGYATRKAVGIAASMVIAYQNAVGRARRAAERAAMPRIGYVGTVGAKVTFGLPAKVGKKGQLLKGAPTVLSGEPVTLDFVTSYDSDFGVVMVYKFRSAEGATLVWKTASDGAAMGRDDVGKRYTLAGTIKAHAEYKGAEQTILTRCTATEVA